MRLLLEALQKMLDAEEAQRIEAEHRFVEVLTFSSFQEIVAMLDKALVEDWIGFPVWARNLAFRLACLLTPNDAEIRYRAAADLRSFGPDWDDEADKLEQEAKELTQLSV